MEVKFEGSHASYNNNQAFNFQIYLELGYVPLWKESLHRKGKRKDVTVNRNAGGPLFAWHSSPLVGESIVAKGAHRAASSSVVIFHFSTPSGGDTVVTLSYFGKQKKQPPSRHAKKKTERKKANRAADGGFSFFLHLLFLVYYVSVDVVYCCCFSTESADISIEK